MAKTVGMISLGCPKNQVDAEIMLKKLVDAGYLLVDEAEKADVVIVNTCAFIEDSKKESIDSILEMIDYKEDGLLKRVVVTGCMAQRYADEIFSEIPEVDAVIGIGANDDIVKACDAVLEGEQYSSFPNNEEMPLEGGRILTTPEYFAYLRIADGCSNCCSYCAIPSIRGKFRSRKIEDVLDEAKALTEKGVKELILIAQDTTRYGEDLYGTLKLPELLDELNKLENLKWIRLLYCYPERITDELIDAINRNEKVCHYIDMPMQHVSGKVLKAMNRPGDRESLTALINKLREKISDVVIRTTFITGFPGETDEDFTALSEFVNEMKLDRVGCFAYSREENTPAYSMTGQVSKKIKEKRVEALMEAQYAIHAENNERLLGKELLVVCEGYDEVAEIYYGRSEMDAPEIDSKIYFSALHRVRDGEFLKVKITEVSDYDLIGKEVK